MISLSKTRQDLSRLQNLCKEAGKVSPKEWPLGLIGVGPDMRAFVKAQEDAPKKVAKKAAPKKKVVEDVVEKSLD